jgi:integrase
MEFRARAFGRTGMRLYDLRHYCATWLLERGATELDVSVQLGHTDGGALVRSTYGHAARSSLERLRAIDSGVVAPLRVASESRAAGESP